jgi:hypothetical protein
VPEQARAGVHALGHKHEPPVRLLVSLWYLPPTFAKPNNRAVQSQFPMHACSLLNCARLCVGGDGTAWCLVCVCYWMQRRQVPKVLRRRGDVAALCKTLRSLLAPLPLSEAAAADAPTSPLSAAGSAHKPSKPPSPSPWPPTLPSALCGRLVGVTVVLSDSKGSPVRLTSISMPTAAELAELAAASGGGSGGAEGSSSCCSAAALGRTKAQGPTRSKTVEHKPFGALTSANFSFTRGVGFGVGFVCTEGLEALARLVAAHAPSLADGVGASGSLAANWPRHGCTLPVLVRTPTSPQYRFAWLTVSPASAFQ